VLSPYTAPLVQAEISFSVGPVPVDDNVGKEVVTRWTSSVANGDSAPALFTDSNGREFLERIYNYRPTWNLSNAEPVRATNRKCLQSSPQKRVGLK